MIRTRYAIWIISLLAALSGIAAAALGWKLSSDMNRVPEDLIEMGLAEVPEKQKSPTPETPETTFKVFWQVWDLVHEEFYHDEPLNRTRMTYGAIRGMLATLNDDYTTFEEPEAAEKTRGAIQGSLEGIGLLVGIREGELVVAGALQDTPASDVGLQNEDIITKIGEHEVAALIAGLNEQAAMERVSEMLRGPVGSTVRLTIRRPPEPETFEVAVVRAEPRDDVAVKVVRETGTETPTVEVITEPVSPTDDMEIEVVTTTLDVDVVRDVESHVTLNATMIHPRVGYIQVVDFNNKTPSEFDSALSDLLTHSPESLILDLRNNHGGVLLAAQQLLGTFYEGIAFYERNSRGEFREFQTFSSGKDTSMLDMPVVVLINEFSASATEVVAGALRERHPDTTLIGTRSYGKASVQNVRWLSDDSSVRITVAFLFTPEKNEIGHVGITPDHVVPASNDPTFQVPCVGSAEPPEGAEQCSDSQLWWGLRYLLDNETPPTPRPTP
jgi:carboxyl-terminal processing protease